MATIDQQQLSSNTKVNSDSVKNMNSYKKVDYDDLLTSAGEFGRYQVFLFISTFPFYIYGVFSYFSQLFMTEVSPNHWCWIPELENFTVTERRALAIPLDPNARFGYSQCEAYIANWTHVITSGRNNSESWKKEPCQYGWEFDQSQIPYPTISSEFGWVCDKNSYQATAQSIFFVGSIFGGFLIGWISDRFGRLPAAVLSNMLGCVGGVISVFSRNLLEFSLCRFLMGMSYDNCMMMTYLLVLEYVAPKYRTLIANMPFAIFFTLGAVILPWIALVCGNWKIIGLATSIPMGLSIVAPLIIPESPQWLLSKGRIDDAIIKVVNIAKFNKKEIPTSLIKNFKLNASKKIKDENSYIIDIIKRSSTRKVFICLCLDYMCCMIIFDVLVRCIDGFNFDFFLSFTFLSLTEFPSLMIISFVLDMTGRKWLSILSLLMCCLFCILTPFVGSGLPSVICAVIARFSVNIAINTAMQWAAEILPTSVRGSGVSIVHICGYVATVISPYIVYLNNYITWLPLTFIGAIAALGAVLALNIPETAGRDMPQTFNDTVDLIKHQKFFDIPCLKKKNTKDLGQITQHLK